MRKHRNWKYLLVLLQFLLLGTDVFCSSQTETEHSAYTFLEIEIPDSTLVEKYRSEYSSGFGLKKLREILEVAAPYRPYIRRKLEENDMPSCLEFLPVIESNYNPKALSKSGAAGLWQFMENSISGYLIKDEWLDERKDPWLSTDAAIKKLKDNYSYFGDWALALAAYNMGLGGLSKLIRNTGLNSFWELAEQGYLKNETLNYVPKFLAIADLVTNADYYGLDLPEYDESAELKYSVIHLMNQTGLEQLALFSCLEYEDLQRLNPSLIYPYTPYGRQYDLRIPEGTEDTVYEALDSLNIIAADIYVVKKGDTLWAISRRYGLTVNDLCEANNISETGILSIGTKLFVPIYKAD